MKQVLGAVALGALISITYGPPQKPRNAPSPTTVLQANREWIMAYEKCDIKVLEGLISLEFINSNFAGGVETKSEFLANIECDNKEGSNSEQSTLEEVKMVSLGDVTVVNCRSSVKGAADSGVRYTNVFVKKRARWWIVSSQSTIIFSANPVLVPPKEQ